MVRSPSTLTEASGAMVNHFQAKFIKQELQHAFSVVNMVGSRPPRPSPDPKTGSGVHLQPQLLDQEKNYKTKAVGKICFSGGRSYFWARNPDLEGPGPHVLLEPWSIIFWQSLLNKRCSTLGLTYLATLTIHFIILI